MNKRMGSIGAAAATRSWTHRFTFVLLVAFAFGLMLIGKPDSIIVSRLRMAVMDVTAPLINAVSRPIDAARETASDVQDYFALKAENEALKRQNDTLMEWQRVARELQAENASLRELLNFQMGPKVSFVTASVVADASSSFVRSLIVLGGTKAGVAKGQAAMTGAGLAGRVLEVGERSARILLITDINARVPVVAERSRDQAVLAGRNSDMPELLYLSRDNDVKVGDRIVTSGQGGVFPAGLPVGEVASVTGGHIQVQPFVDFSRLENIRLIDYSLPGILMQDLGVDTTKALSPNNQTGLLSPGAGE
ncbi:MAG: rod shape-determining protein MreC [Proteobacteria bacterium]|nr:rod shape-determining protein MreC [Pseudomonadota bacterium]